MTKKEFLITVIVVVLAIALVATVIVLKRADNAANGTPTTAVPHDHNGDGIPDHGDDGHNEGTKPSESADPNDSDVDISVDLEDIPSGEGTQGGTDSTKPTTGNNDSTEPTTGGNDSTEPTTGGNNSTEPTTGGNDSTEPTTGGNDSTEPTTGGNDSTEPTTGGNSGAVSGNEIDFDDLLNAGKN